MPATRRLVVAAIVILSVSFLLTLTSAVWEWEDVVVTGESVEADEWLAVAAACWLPLLAIVLVRLIGLYRRLRRTAEAAVDAFRNTVDSVPGWVWQTDENLRVTYSSAAVEELLGYAPAAMVGRDLAELFAPEPVRYEHFDGTARYLRSSVTPVRDQRGRVTAYHGFSTDVTAERECRERREAGRARIEAALSDPDGLRIVFQPIVDVGTGQLVGVEALSRFTAEPYRAPDVWFDEAWELGLGPALELHALAAACRALPELPDGAYLSLNVAPATMLDDRFAALLDSLGPDAARVVVEVTEHAVVDDYAALAEVVRQIRPAGCRLAVDDAGAGYASMQHILRLSPDIIKLDRGIVDHADTDPARRALLTAMATFAASLGMTVVAEGVERAEEVAALTEAGVRLAQGYHFARPDEDPRAWAPELAAAPH